MNNGHDQAGYCGKPRSDAMRANPVRVTLGRQLGHEIDGAWWPRRAQIADELPDLVALLGERLGKVIQINANWSPLRRPPDLNWFGWRHKRQYIMTISGCSAQANLLIVPHSTHSTLAILVLRQAADLPIDRTHRNSEPFCAANSVLSAARLQHASLTGDTSPASDTNRFLTATKTRMGVHVSIQNPRDAPQIHPSQIRVGDVIGTTDPIGLHYTVKLISGPQTRPRRWTFFGRDAEGLQRTNTFGEDDLVCRYAKAS